MATLKYLAGLGILGTVFGVTQFVDFTTIMAVLYTLSEIIGQ